MRIIIEHIATGILIGLFIAGACCLICDTIESKARLAAAWEELEQRAEAREAEAREFSANH